MAALYLIPTPLGETAAWDVALPAGNRTVLEALDYFVVENTRTARRFLSSTKISRSIDSLTFAELNEHTPPETVEALLDPLLKQGRSIGLMSEAGLPCIADPGALLVAAAHRRGVRVIPLSGASSITLALMASGANGQSFAFNGYLPIKSAERQQAIRRFEKRAQTEGQSQIFIEAPYRNVKLLEDLVSSCAPQTMLCVAVDLLESEQWITSRSIAEWRKAMAAEAHSNTQKEKTLADQINKRPAIFILF